MKRTIFTMMMACGLGLSAPAFACEGGNQCQPDDDIYATGFGFQLDGQVGNLGQGAGIFNGASGDVTIEQDGFSRLKGRTAVLSGDCTVDCVDVGWDIEAEASQFTGVKVRAFGDQAGEAVTAESLGLSATTIDVSGIFGTANAD